MGSTIDPAAEFKSYIKGLEPKEGQILGSKADADTAKKKLATVSNEPRVKAAEEFISSSLAESATFQDHKIDTYGMLYNDGSNPLRNRVVDGRIATQRIEVLQELSRELESKHSISDLAAAMKAQRGTNLGMGSRKMPLEILLDAYMARLNAEIHEGRSEAEENKLKTQLQEMIQADLVKIRSNISNYEKNNLSTEATGIKAAVETGSAVAWYRHSTADARAIQRAYIDGVKASTQTTVDELIKAGQKAAADKAESLATGKATQAGLSKAQLAALETKEVGAVARFAAKWVPQAGSLLFKGATRAIPVVGNLMLIYDLGASVCVLAGLKKEDTWITAGARWAMSGIANNWRKLV